jgi:eukaryotic-like serine/threonine-protein kinase
MMPRRTPWWVFACAASFVAYFGLLVYCDVRRPEPEGLAFAFDGGLTVREVWRDSAADRAGLRPGDVIASVDGQALTADKMDWVAVTTNVEFDRPLQLVVRRDGRPFALALALRQAPSPLWATREGLDLLGVRAVQLAALALGLVLLFRRPSDPVARLGAWLQGSLAVFCVVLPFRIAAVWRSLWWPAGALLWLPFASSLLLGALLLTFFLEFPVRRVRRAWWLAIWGPLAAAAAPFLRFHLHVVYWPATSLTVDDGLSLLLWVSTAYLAATVAVAAWSYRRLRDESERRRLRVLFAGAVLGCAATGPIVVGWWQTGTLALFGGRTMAWLAPLLVTVPASLAYAILRHRLFDLRLIVRRGVQYALARRVLVSLVPALLLAMVVDLYLHRGQAMGDVVAARASVYLLLLAAALVARFQRQRWLELLDRRFFRERYDAQRILRRVAEEVRESGSLEQVGEAVVSRIEVALHPRFVALLVKAAGGEWFRPLAAAPRGMGPERIPAAARVAAIARLLGRPLEVSTRETAPLGQQLPDEELAMLREAGLELLVPIGSEADGREALLALGARRSEEPYAREDEDLLQAIAGTLGLLMARDQVSGTPVPSMRECPRCGACCDDTTRTCPADGSALAAVRLPRTLVARYRLERRLGRGGMGTVYSAADLMLHRSVAVKVLRDDLAADAEAAGRFEREARTAAGLSHPNVVTIHDFGLTVRGRGFLVMEHLEGRTLREVLEAEGPLPPARVLGVLLPVCAAVDAAHRRQLVHRDLKPENVFLARVEGREIPKILDFGIAKALRPASAGTPRDTGGVMLGTPEYMAPEQLRGEAAAPAWDVWALAVLAFEMLTGRHPFESTVRLGGTPPAGLAGAEGGPGGSLAVFGGDCAAFFASALAVDPGARPATATEFSAGLERGLAGQVRA